MKCVDAAHVMLIVNKETDMTARNTLVRRRVGALFAGALVSASGAAVMTSGVAQAQTMVCDLPDTPEVIETCAAAFNVQYAMYNAQGERVLEVLPGQTYTVKQQVIPTGPSAVGFEAAKDTYIMQDNPVRIDFLDAQGKSTMSDLRMGEDGKFHTFGKITSKTGEIYIPREARNELGPQGIGVIKLTYKDGTFDMLDLPMDVKQSEASRHELKVRNNDGNDITDRSTVAKIDMMVGAQEVFSLENLETAPKDKELGGAGDDTGPARLFVTDEYGNNSMYDNDGGADNVSWARIEQFQHEGQDRYRMRLEPGEAQLDNGQLKKNTLYVTAQYQDGTWRTNTIEVNVRPHEELQATQTLPATTVQAWTVKEVELQGQKPSITGGEIRYLSNEQNPSWMTVNKYSGKVTYKPQLASVELRSYPVVIDVKSDTGQTMHIASTVTVTQNENSGRPDAVTRTGDTDLSMPNQTPQPKRKQGIFAKFWDALTSVFD